MSDQGEHHEGHIHLQVTTGDVVRQLEADSSTADHVENLGKIAYRAYADAAGQSLVTGDALPPWEELAYQIQNGWKCAGIAVAREIVE